MIHNSTVRAAPTVEYSIVILNHNYGRFLSNCIESVLAQTINKSIEIIVVDDGSTDDSLVILNSYTDYVISVKKGNGGQASAINAGFLRSSGSRVLFLDANDHLNPSCLEIVHRNWKAGTSGFSFNLTFMDEVGKPSERLCRPARKTSVTTWITGGVVDSMPMSGNVFSRAFLNTALPMPEGDWRRSADVYLCSVAAFTGKTTHIQQSLGAYRVHSQNGSKLIKNNRLDLARLSFIIDRDLRIDAIQQEWVHRGRAQNAQQRALTWSLAHQQLRYLHVVASKDRRSSSSDWRPPTFPSLGGLILKSDLKPYKKAIIWAWSAMLLVVPRLLKDILLIAGVRNGLVLSASKTLERS